MARTVAIGIQSFEEVRKGNYFYVDKTYFIKEWWERCDDVTLIARPRQFGKTLNMNMLETFFQWNIKTAGIYLRGFSSGRTENTGICRELIR